MMKIKQQLAVLIMALMSTATFAQEHIVEMLNNGDDGMMVFEPGFLKVEKGDTVKFLSTDMGHNSVSTYVPEGATEWNGRLNEEIVVTMDQEGVYIYKCTPHIALAMIGVIQVGNATNMDAANSSAKEMKSKFMMSQERLEDYLAEVK
jgi:pseudoazurin